MPKGRAEANREYALRAMVRNRDWLQATKIEKGCIDCGYREHPEALDFDHRPGEIKNFILGHAGTRSLAVVQLEAAKCDVRCANCHRVLSARRRAEGVVVEKGPRPPRQQPVVDTLAAYGRGRVMADA